MYILTRVVEKFYVLTSDKAYTYKYSDSRGRKNFVLTSDKAYMYSSNVPQAPQTLPTLRDLPDGHIGKIRVRKSGKVE